MKKTQFKKNTMCLFFAALLLSTSSLAQLICDMGDRDRFISEIPTIPSGDIFTENSGLAYHPKENILIVILDKPVNFEVVPSYITRHILGYNFDKDEDENKPFPIHISNFSDFMDINYTDFEGITHLKDNYFALVEESENKIYFLEYRPNDYEFKVLSTHLTGIPVVEGSEGLNDIAYDPHTKRLYLVNEVDSRLYSIEVNQLPGPDSSAMIGQYKGGSNFDIVPNDFNSTDGLNSAAGLFHLGQIYPANHPLSNNLLVVNWNNPQIMLEIEVSLDNDDNLYDQSINLIKRVNFDTAEKNEPKPQSIVVIDNAIYIGSDSVISDGGVSRYIIKSVYDRCEDDINIYNEACECIACPSKLWVNTNGYTDDYSLTDSYESSEFIETVVTNTSEVDVVIHENEVVDLKSDHIKLNEGFKVESGACLNATIESCK